MHTEKKKLNSVLLLVCISYIGVALPYPILAPIFIGAEPDDVAKAVQWPPEILLGAVLAAYPLGMFLGGHVLGALADYYGRKPVIRWTQMGVAMSYVLSAYALSQDNYFLLLCSRLLTGLFEGNIAIARSIAADLSHVIPKVNSFSYIHAAVYIGYLIGPLIGGALLYVSASAPFYFAAFLALIAALYFEWSFKESLIKPKGVSESEANKFNAWVLLKTPLIRQLCLVNTLSALSISTFYQFYPLYLIKVYEFTSDGIAILTGALTLSLIFSSLVVVKLGQKYFSLAVSLILSLGFYIVTVLAMMLFSNLWLFSALFILLGIFIVTTGTYMGVYLSDHTSADDQGKLMGLLASLSAMCTALIIILASFLSTYSPYFPFIACMLFSIISLILFVNLHLKSSRSADSHLTEAMAKKV